MNISKKKFAVIGSLGLLLIAVFAFVISGCASPAEAAPISEGNQEVINFQQPAAAQQQQQGTTSCATPLAVVAPDVTILGQAVYTAEVTGDCFSLPALENSYVLLSPHSLTWPTLELSQEVASDGTVSYHSDGRRIGDVQVILSPLDSAEDYGFTGKVASSYGEDLGYAVSPLNNDYWGIARAGYYIGANSSDHTVQTGIVVHPLNPMGTTLSVELRNAGSVSVEGCNASVVSLSELQNGENTAEISISGPCSEILVTIQGENPFELTGVLVTSP